MEMSSQPEGGHFLKVRQETPRSAVKDCDGVTVTNLLSSNNVPIKIVNDGHSRLARHQTNSLLQSITGLSFVHFSENHRQEFAGNMRVFFRKCQNNITG